MCTCQHLSRRNMLIAMVVSGLPLPALADDATQVIGGSITENGDRVTKVTRKKFTLKSGAEGGVIQQRGQLFYLDPATEAEFFREDTGLIGSVVIKAGGVLSAFGPSSGSGARIITPNAVGSIRGTTTYFAWQEAEQRTYVCCCYGGVDLENGKGGGENLRTSYHTAVVLPSGGGVETAPYSVPLNHYDDDIVKLEEKAGRSPRWQLPDGKMHFFAPRPVPLT